MRKFIAEYIIPVSARPIKNGILITDDKGVIIELLPMEELDYALMDAEYCKGIICPGFVNVHCHLELSYLKDAIQEHGGLDEFVVRLQSIRKAEDSKIVNAAVDAEHEMKENGIVAVGDISNTNHTFALKESSPLSYHTFVESFSSDANRADRAFEKALKLFNEIAANKNNSRASVTPHATYSLSPPLFEKVRQFAMEHKSILTLHHQESEDENSFFSGADEKISQRQKKFGVEHSVFYNTGLRPLPSVKDYLPAGNRMLLVHNTVSGREDIRFAQNNFKEIYWCFCPNSNLYIENKLPDFAIFIDDHCKITLGTDSLASNKCLSILEEMKTISRCAPSVHLETLMEWATRNGAEFLGFDAQLGTLEKGKQPGINLIKDVDAEALQLLPESNVKRLL